VAETTKQLVEADAQSRKELIALERDLQAERTTIGRQRDQLEQERRDFAKGRYWDSLIAKSLGSAGIVIASLLPLVLCWYLLHGLRRENSEEELGVILAHELVGDSSVLLPSIDNEPRGLPDPFQDHDVDDAIDLGEEPQ
jgi:hypothetical protein